MDKAAIYDMLKKQKISHEIDEHEAVFNMTELSNQKALYPDSVAKNLFVRDDKKRNYIMITVRGNKRVKLKDFEKAHAFRHLSFASPNDMQKYLGVQPGSVSPFGLLNDKDCVVKWFYDADFAKSQNHMAGVHPNDNTATVWLKIEDLINIIQQHGNLVAEVTLS